MKQLPDKWSWLYNEPAPCMLKEALKHYGTLEHPGHGSNPNISAWAKEVGVSGWYTDDDIPWCGLFVGVVALRCHYAFAAGKLLGARNWLEYGTPIPIKEASLWDIMIYARPGGGHVAFNVGFNGHAYLNYGGNQSNAVGFAWIDKSRLIGVRRPNYKIGTPPNIRPILLSETGELSSNEA